MTVVYVTWLARVRRRVYDSHLNISDHVTGCCRRHVTVIRIGWIDQTDASITELYALVKVTTRSGNMRQCHESAKLLCIQFTVMTTWQISWWRYVLRQRTFHVWTATTLKMGWLSIVRWILWTAALSREVLVHCGDRTDKRTRPTCTLRSQFLTQFYVSNGVYVLQFNAVLAKPITKFIFLLTGYLNEVCIVQDVSCCVYRLTVVCRDYLYAFNLQKCI